MKAFPRSGLLALFGIGLVTWWGLDQLEPRAKWLQVEAPRYIELGQTLTLQVHLAPLSSAQFLTADLHRARIHDRSEGYLATGGSRAVGAEGGTYDFAIEVQPRPGLRLVRAVLFLSRTGDWGSRTQVATSESIEVVTNGLSKPEPRVVPLQMTANVLNRGAYPPPSPAPRMLTGLVLLLAAVLAWRRHRVGMRGRANVRGQVSYWAGLALALALAAFWEFSFAENRVSDMFRSFAHRGDWYHLRGPIQKVAVSVIVGLLVAIVPWLFRASGSQRVLIGALLFYVGVSAVDLVSLHAIDQVADLSWRGLTVIQALKLACATALLLGVARAGNSSSSLG